MRVATRSRKARSWVMNSTLERCETSSSSSQRMPSKSRWLVGSSSSSTSGCSTSARASATRFFMPPDSASTSCAPSRPICASVVATRVRQFQASCRSSEDCSVFMRAISASCSAPSGVSARRCAITSNSSSSACVCVRPEATALEHRLPRAELGLLLHVDRHQVLLARDQAVVGAGQFGDDLQQRGLARPVAADETDALAGFEREIRVIEQRDVTERKLRAGNGIERHGGSGEERDSETPIVTGIAGGAASAGWPGVASERFAGCRALGRGLPGAGRRRSGIAPAPVLMRCLSDPR